MTEVGLRRGPLDTAHVVPAGEYEPADDLAVVTCFFNSEGYESKLDALRTFAGSLDRSPLALYRAEVSYGDGGFFFPDDDRTLRLHGHDRLWQKERLLNLLVAGLPERYTKIVWVDADILFENPAWASETSRVLDDFPVAQPYSHGLRLGPGELAHPGESVPWLTYAAVRSVLPHYARYGPWWAHGQPGFAWAARRDILENVGLYDAAVVGGGDDLIAHAFGGDFASPCLPITFYGDTSYLAHYRRWAESAFAAVGGRVGFVEGAALHLWHGELGNRGYGTRRRELAGFGYDPDRHLRASEDGLWRWSDSAGAMRDWCAGYFASRREDEQG